MRHRDQWYPGEHPPIVDSECWAQAHAILATNGRQRANATRAKVDYLLKGIVFDPEGRALSPWQTTKKNGRRYRYYVSQRDKKECSNVSGLPRLPAGDLEATVVEQLGVLLRSPAVIADMVPKAVDLDPRLDEAQVTVAMTRLTEIWGTSAQLNRVAPACQRH